MAINIKDTSKSTFTPDMNLNPPMDMSSNFSSSKATYDSIYQGLVNLNNQLGQLKLPEQKQEPAQQKSILDSITGRAQASAPVKTNADYAKELADMRTSFLESQGITQADYTQRTELGNKLASFNAELDKLELQNIKDKDDVARQVGVTRGYVNAVQNQIDRDYLFKRAMVSAEASGVAAQYQVLQGRFDDANKLFTESINYATTRERQDVEDYKWAIDFYTDIEKTDRAYLQQELENKQKELESQAPELRTIGDGVYQFTYNKDTNSWESKLLRSAPAANNWSAPYTLNGATVQRNNSTGEIRTISGTKGETGDTFTDTVNYLVKLRDSGNLTDFSYREQINALMEVGGYSESQRGQIESMVNQAMEIGNIEQDNNPSSDFGTFYISSPEQAKKIKAEMATKGLIKSPEQQKLEAVKKIISKYNK